MRYLKHKVLLAFALLLLGLVAPMAFSPVYAAEKREVPSSATPSPSPGPSPSSTETPTTGSDNTTLGGTPVNTTAGHQCGVGDQAVTTSIAIGCRAAGNPIIDVTFAIIRLLSMGVGLVVVGSIIVGGIQYTASHGDPQATAKAITRIRAAVIALVIFIFGYAILNYIIPAGVFSQ